MPVYRETLDEPLGMIHVKGHDRRHRRPRGPRRFDLMKLKRDMQFVTPSMPALDLLLKMQATRSHLALVIDEYGGTDGLSRSRIWSNRSSARSRTNTIPTKSPT